MDQRLAGEEYLAGVYSIADIACFPWVMQHDWAGLDISALTHLRRWLAVVGARPAVQRGMAVPQPQALPDIDTGRTIVTAASKVGT